MNIKTLDGYEQQWNVAQHKILSLDQPLKSAPHKRAKDVLRCTFPTCQILEEVDIPTYSNRTQYLDFYLPLLQIAVEVHGEQHYSYIPFFQKFPLQFYYQKKLDRNKATWCDLNDIELIILRHDEDDDTWANQLFLARCQG